MALTYYISVTLALLAGTLPVQILGVIWESIGESIAVEIPYIALLRLLGGAGAVAAVILSDRIRGYIMARDLIVGAIALEAMSLIGFSLSREFWNLGVWITALGFSFGLCLALICYLLRGTRSGKTGYLFISSAIGTAVGVCLVRYILSGGRSWRTACQGLAILQIILCMSVFLLRRTLLRDVAAILKKRKDEARTKRQMRREKLIREKGGVREDTSQAWLIRLLFLYGAALCCGLLLLSAIHLTYAARVIQGAGTSDLTQSIVYVCLGMAAGRVVISLAGKDAVRSCRIGWIVTMAALVPCAAAAWLGYEHEIIWLFVRLGVGCGAGMIFPNLIRIDDERLDDELQTGMAGLIPAFYLGADAMITPFVQSVSGAFGLGACTTVLLTLACCMGICLLFALMRTGRQ